MPANSVVCTLFEGRYGLGVGALLNSLIASGFAGRFVAGYRGVLPTWAQRVAKHGNGLYEVSGVKVHLIPLETDRHLTHYKAIFVKNVIKNDQLSENDTIAYFDPDIIVRGQWQFFEKWCTYGIALCEDAFSPMHSTHPKRRMWQELFPDLYGAARELQVYVNAGFFALKPRDGEVLDIWEDVIRRGYDPSMPLTSDPHDAFSVPDQDALNIAITATARPVSIVGPEQMDFRPGGYLMSHAIGRSKPWDGGFCRRVVRGRGLRLADRFFVKAMSHPIRVFDPWQEARLRLDFELARVLNVVRGSSP